MPTPRRTRAALASVLLLVTASPYAPADTPPLDARPAAEKSEAVKSAASETYDKILAEFETASREFNVAYSAAKDDATRQTLFKEKYPDSEAYAKRFVASAKAAPDDPAAVDALVWAAGRTSRGEAHDEALRLLYGRYVESPKLEMAIQRMAYSQSPAAADALRAIAE